jgi:hypothetical protein
MLALYACSSLWFPGIRLDGKSAKVEKNGREAVDKYSDGLTLPSNLWLCLLLRVLPIQGKSLATSATYYTWLAGTGQIDPASLGCDFNWPGSAAALAGGILAETMHILTIDHPGANHHIIPNDQCADTPEYTEANMMDCHGPKCALTRCQLGRAHHFLSNNNPVYQRFQVGNNQYSTTEDYCTILDPVIVIANNENITWSTARRLRSNVIIEEGGSLTINCDVGLPENATIIVEQGGTLNIDGAKVYNNCDGTYWGGIIV